MPDNALTTLSQKPLVSWNLEDVTTAAKAGLPTTYPVARAMLEDHDYLQGGKLWIGQRAEAGLSQEQMRRIKDVFVPDPLLEEIKQNRTNGLLKREATVTFEPTKPIADADSQAQKDRVTTVLQGIAHWWDKRKLWDKARAAFGRTSYSRRAALRYYVPSANLDNLIGTDGKPVTTFRTVTTLPEALDLIAVEAPLPDLAGRFTLASQEQVALVLTGDEQNRQAELWSVEGGTTVVRVLNRFGDRMAGKPTLTVPYDLGGRLPVVEIETLGELVTDPIIKQQSLLNLNSTMLESVLETAGFPDRFIENAEPPGLWLHSPPEGVPLDEVDTAKDSSDATIYKHRVPWLFGFRPVTELVGLKTTETLANGGERTGYQTPTVQRFDPVDPTYLKTAREMIRNTIYKNCRQGHYASETIAEASGLAYQQHRAQFEDDLETLKGSVEGLIRDSIEVVLAYAGLMHAETKQFLEDFRCVVTVHVTSGPITPAEMMEVRANRDARLIAQSTAMGRLGVEDIGAEQTAIDADPANLAAKWLAIAGTIDALTKAAPVDSAGAAFLLGLSPEQIEVFRTGTAPVAAPSKPALTAA